MAAKSAGAIVSGLVGPDAPDSERWETLWHYMQGGPGVFKGDLYFYKLDGDIRDRVAQIDTRALPAVPAVGRIRLFLHAGGNAGGGRTAFPAARSPS